VLSLAFVSPRTARALNAHYRGKSYTPNILTFPLGPREGEIIMCPAVTRRQARAEGSDYAQFMKRLFIHGLLHLRGYAHGTKMRSAEYRFATRAEKRGS
jgi:probable rRNA maturation factor